MGKLNNAAFGNKIEKLMQKNGLLQKELAGTVGVDPASSFSVAISTTNRRMEIRLLSTCKIYAFMLLYRGNHGRLLLTGIYPGACLA